MNATQKGIATLIKSAITSKSYTLPDGFDMDAAYEIIKRHHIVTLAYVGAVNCGISKALLPMQYMFRRYFNEIDQSDRQQKEAHKLCSAFEEQDIDYMCLKGINMKNFYPAPELRKMGDVDILVRETDYPKAEKILKTFGYQDDGSAEHHRNWRKNKVLFEIHLRIVSKSSLFYSYFGNGWSFAKLHNENRYAMSPEDEYIFLFVHFANHFRCGIGCRHMTDIWVYRNTHPDLDFEYISAQLELLGLDTFHSNVVKTLDVWFNDALEDDVTEIITRYVFERGNWGNSVSSAVAHSAVIKSKTGSKHTRLQTALFIFFLPYSDMKRIFPVLERLPVLLPVFWIVRGFQTLFFRRKNIGKNLKRINAATSERVSAYETDMKSIGFDYSLGDLDQE